MSQVLTNHGCYLHMIGKERTTGCHHCAAGQDSAQQTLEECSAWDEERRLMTAVVGPDLSLPALVTSMLKGEDKWEAVSFCDKVMSQKEEAERIRRGERPPPTQPGGNDDGGNGGQMPLPPPSRPS